ncbi:hypothetical protein CHS0354_040430 [Potamilus streckersoni]|uniref:Uncharacterized protein n=1 Tax=Potamilus streckersoni TaxID=2493646 RepID=A0AAE0T021_9BIVA|nr:hypothetical protein CHS0354_040430 [Potamilus streckersoni]
MPSNMMATKLLLPIAFLLSPLSSKFGYVDVATIVPSISIGTCSPLINGKSFAICCKASFLDGALVGLYGPKKGIFLPYNLPVSYILNNSLSLMCSNETIGDITFSCRRTEFESVYLVNFPSFDQNLHLGDWSCGTYMGSAKLTVSSREVITRNDGLVETKVNQTAQLLWNVLQDYVVISPSYEVLVNVSGNVLYSKSDRVEFVRNNATGKTGIRLNNTSGSDAGRYVFQASNGVRAALYLQVQEKPTQPKVIYRNLHNEGFLKVASAILYCWSESQSKGPIMYEQRIKYRWNGLTSQAGLHVGLYGSGVIVWNVDCTKVTSYPISCNAEQYGLESETTWIIPQSLCLMSESGGNVYETFSTPAPNIGVIIGATVSSVSTILIFMGVFIWLYCVHRSSSQGCVSCRYMCECSCHRRCCQATRNRFTTGFQAIRGCFHSTVTFIQHCHLRRRERNQNEENNSPLPDGKVDFITKKFVAFRWKVDFITKKFDAFRWKVDFITKKFDTFKENSRCHHQDA